MTIPPLQGGVSGQPFLRVPVLTAPVSTGVPPVVGEKMPGATPNPAGLRPAETPPRREDAPISLAGRLDTGDLLPATTQLALALESATRSMQKGQAHDVLRALDDVWSDLLDADSPWYLRAAALQLLGRTSDAEQVLRNAITRLPRSAALLYLLGIHTAERGHLDAAKLANDHALALHPTEPLLRLQGAALSMRGSGADAIAGLLDEIRTAEPGFPAEIWLATLIRLHDDAERRGATRAPRVTAERLTPIATRAVVEHANAGAPPELRGGVLDTALRYGLSLLESPTHSARVATHAALRAEPAMDVGGAVAGSHVIAPTRTALPTWEALTLVAALVVMVVVPPLRVPALLFAGVASLSLASRRLR